MKAMLKRFTINAGNLREDAKNIIFNQFDEFGNPIYHYNITGAAIEEVFEKFIKKDKEKLAAYISATGSAGTIAAGDYLKKVYPHTKTVASEALTMSYNPGKWIRWT